MDVIEHIESKIDRVETGSQAVDMAIGGVRFQNMMEVMNFAKLMSVSGLALPVHLRGNPGACLAVCTRALRFGFDPFALAEHSYTMVKNVKNGNQWDKVETIAYDSFVIRGIIAAHAKLTGQIVYTYEGQGDERVCIATCQPPGAAAPIVHRSPTLGALKAARGRNDQGVIKGSPLWETKPDQQMGYDTGRDLCRLYFPEVLLGWYDKDEMDENVPAPKQVTAPGEPSALRKRLQSRQRTGDRGFDHEKVNQTIDGEVARTEPETASAETPTESSAAPPEPAETVAAEAEAMPPAEVSAATTDPDPAPESPTLAQDAPKPEPPVVPTDGAQYVAYAKGIVAMFETAEEVRAWWKSKEQKSLRNSLPNMVNAVFEGAEEACRERVEALKAAKPE